MFYRENGQFKTSYRTDQQIFPIAQDRWAILALIAFAFVGVPLLADEYMFRAILIPFLILALAALGVNILVGYCGQISLGSGAFMAVGAYGAYNFFVRFPGMPLIPALILGGLCATFFGILFGLPSLRVKGLYLAVATLAAQFFSDWMFLRIKWFTNNSDSGSVSVEVALKMAIQYQAARGRPRRHDIATTPPHSRPTRATCSPEMDTRWPTPVRRYTSQSWAEMPLWSPTARATISPPWSRPGMAASSRSRTAARTRSTRCIGVPGPASTRIAGVRT